MSLLRLLTTGKSLVGLKKLEHRYHLPGEKAIPQFGAKKNPFRATVFPEKVEPGEPEAGSGAGSPDLQLATEGFQSDAGPEAGLAPGLVPMASLATESGQPASPSAPGEAPVQRPSGLRALFLWGRARKSRPGGPASGRPLVQAELSLDSIRVVRNDLSESDLEVVPAEPCGRRAQAAQPVAAREPLVEFPEAPRSSGMSRVCGVRNM